jgi:hypothetical protein
MPHRERVSYFSRGCAHAVRGHSPEIKKASQPVGHSHHLTSGGKADRLGSGCGLVPSVQPRVAGLQLEPKYLKTYSE